MAYAVHGDYRACIHSSLGLSLCTHESCSMHCPCVSNARFSGGAKRHPLKPKVRCRIPRTPAPKAIPGLLVNNYRAQCEVLLSIIAILPSSPSAAAFHHPIPLKHFDRSH